MSSAMRYAIVRDGLVDGIVLWDGQSDWAPPSGCVAMALADGEACAPGWSLVNGEWVAPEPILTVMTWDMIRAERDRLLAASDWTQLADAPVDAAAWAVYRQELRDIPQDFASPDAVVWPSAP